MKYAIFGLLSALAILTAIVSLAYAGVIDSNENIPSNMTSNMTSNLSNITSSMTSNLSNITSNMTFNLSNTTSNMTSNLSNTTSNITLNQTTGQAQIVIGGGRDGINKIITLNALEIITSNATRNASREGKILRAGGKSAKASKVLGGNSSRQKAGTEVGLEPKAEFNLSQRLGNVSIFKANSDIYTPLFSQNQYRRTRPAYQAPDNLSNREVYNITGYPVIMLPNSIP